VVAIVRSDPASICRARPPYQKWERKRLDRYIGGPLLACWHGRYLVGGRKRTDGPARTVLYWLTDEDQLVQFAELPSGGDNSYPGFVALSPNHALVSWYSSHEKTNDGHPLTAIYLADLFIKLQGNQHDSVRAFALRKMREFNTIKVVRVLIDNLTHHDSHMRDLAAESLCWLDSARNILLFTLGVIISCSVCGSILFMFRNTEK